MCDGSATRLISRKLNGYKSFDPLARDITAALRGHCAVLDGEIVCLAAHGKPQFYDLLRRRAVPYFYVFDIVHLDGRDLHGLPVVERKAVLKALVPDGSRLLYAGHVDARGVDNASMWLSVEPPSGSNQK